MTTTERVHTEPMAPPTKDTVQITFRIPKDWLARADALAAQIAPPGATFGRTDAFRAAIVKGLEALEREEKRRVAKQDPRPYVNDRMECLFCGTTLDIPGSAWSEVMHAEEVGCPIVTGAVKPREIVAKHGRDGARAELARMAEAFRGGRAPKPAKKGARK